MGTKIRSTYRKAAKAYLASHRGKLVPDPAAEPGPTRWSDPWLLLAILDAQRDQPQATLERIYAAGDVVNHAIFTDDELMGGFARLEGGGFIAVQGATCAVTGRFLETWTTAGGDRRSLNKRLETLRKILAAPPWTPSAAG